MANPLHDLADVFHKLGEEIKNIAEKIESAFAKDEAPVVAEAEHAVETIGEDALKAAETAAGEATAAP